MRYRSLIVFRLGGWSPLLPTGFLVSRGTLGLAPYLRLPLRAFHPLRTAFPNGSGQLLSVVAALNPARPQTSGLASYLFARHY